MSEASQYDRSNSLQDSKQTIKFLAMSTESMSARFLEDKGGEHTMESIVLIDEGDECEIGLADLEVNFDQKKQEVQPNQNQILVEENSLTDQSRTNEESDRQ